MHLIVSIYRKSIVVNKRTLNSLNVTPNDNRSATAFSAKIGIYKNIFASASAQKMKNTTYKVVHPVYPETRDDIDSTTCVIYNQRLILVLIFSSAGDLESTPRG